MSFCRHHLIQQLPQSQVSGAGAISNSDFAEKRQSLGYVAPLMNVQMAYVIVM